MNSILVSGAVEGVVDEALLRALLRYVGALPGPIYGKNGKAYLMERLSAYNKAATHRHWVVLVDLDNDADCARISVGAFAAPAKIDVLSAGSSRD